MQIGTLNNKLIRSVQSSYTKKSILSSSQLLLSTSSFCPFDYQLTLHLQDKNPTSSSSNPKTTTLHQTPTKPPPQRLHGFPLHQPSTLQPQPSPLQPHPTIPQTSPPPSRIRRLNLNARHPRSATPAQDSRKDSSANRTNSTYHLT